MLSTSRTGRPCIYRMPLKPGGMECYIACCTRVSWVVGVEGKGKVTRCFLHLVRNGRAWFQCLRNQGVWSTTWHCTRVSWVVGVEEKGKVTRCSLHIVRDGRGCFQCLRNQGDIECNVACCMRVRAWQRSVMWGLPGLRNMSGRITSYLKSQLTSQRKQLPQTYGTSTSHTLGKASHRELHIIFRSRRKFCLCLFVGQANHRSVTDFEVQVGNSTSESMYSKYNLS